ncbi:hypothetical protein vBValSX1_163 [Vibrio phage vB_ValS_X1]|uniref:Uncharacterized protein n=2 Tax=Pogseptimavirus TaxID=2732037 RepID=A0A6M9Z7B2_9CAUD|nr:hypothetical protein vBValSX1_163 [Vibrio phage vB_ValS_X1]
MFKELDKLLKTQQGLTKEKYYMICEQLGQEPDPNKVPKDLSDMPHVVQVANIIYKSLSDVFIPLGMTGSIFGGKDYSALPVFFDIYEVRSPRDKELVTDIILHMEKKAIEQAVAERKRNASKK